MSRATNSSYPSGRTSCRRRPDSGVRRQARRVSERRAALWCTCGRIGVGVLVFGYSVGQDGWCRVRLSGSGCCSWWWWMGWCRRWWSWGDGRDVIVATEGRWLCWSRWKRLSVDGGADERVGHVESWTVVGVIYAQGRMLSVMAHFRCERLPDTSRASTSRSAAKTEWMAVSAALVLSCARRGVSEASGSPCSVRASSRNRSPSPRGSTVAP